jgi:hypothetical protein
MVPEWGEVGRGHARENHDIYVYIEKKSSPEPAGQF